ncbi:MAG: hypothetical protein H7328_06345 [Bdellovibrio sp.]|nr:hypothetical protein [Bdellovibrio sp.]
MKTSVVIFLSVIALTSCQSKPTNLEDTPGGDTYGFLPPPVWNASMQNLKQDMLTLEPFIFDKARFIDPANHEFLSKEIHKLAVESKNVKHDPVILTKDPTVRFVAEQFADELQKADENFKAGWPDYTRWQLAKVTSFCLECHTRIRQGPEFNPRDTARPFLNTLPVAEQIEFRIAFRQFNLAYGLALKNLQQIQSSTMVHEDADRIARLALLVSVQHMQDIEKTKKIIQAIERNSTLPLYLKKTNKLWKKSVAVWNPNEVFNQLPAIRNLISTRVSEIEDMRAIPALLRLLTEGQNRSELGESLFLTGESYESLNKISMMSLHENYYESCVRKAPRTKWAQLCFDKLSNSVALSYSGSGGTRIPRDIKNRMEELQKVIQRPVIE